MAGMDDRLDPTDMITMEAMSGLAKVFERIEESCVRPILINIALRIRPCFEKVHVPQEFSSGNVVITKFVLSLLGNCFAVSILQIYMPHCA